MAVYHDHLTWLRDDSTYFASAQGQTSIFWFLSEHRCSQNTEASCSAAAASSALSAVWELSSSDDSKHIPPTEDELIKSVDCEGRDWWLKTRPTEGYPARFKLDELYDSMIEAIDVFKVPCRIDILRGESDGFEKQAQDLFKCSEQRECVLVLNFTMAVCREDSCAGHFALMGAYNEQDRDLLVMEVSSKRGHFWVPEHKILEDMARPDPVIDNKTRGILSFWPL